MYSQYEINLLLEENEGLKKEVKQLHKDWKFDSDRFQDLKKEHKELQIKYDYLKSEMERLKRLINDNPTSNGGGEFFDANISSIEYERDEDDKSLLRGIAIFNCQNIEAL